MGLEAAAALAAATWALGLKQVGGVGALLLLHLVAVDNEAAPEEGQFAVGAGVLMGAPPPPLPLAGGFPLPTTSEKILRAFLRGRLREL